MATKFRKGDIVSVQGTVTYDYEKEDGDDGHVHVEIPGAIRSDTYIKPQMLTMVRQTIVLGDSIEFEVSPGDAETYRCGTVLAISNEHAWIDLGGGDYCTRTLSSIKRLES